MDKEIQIVTPKYKFSDFAKSISDIPREYQNNDWFTKLRELDAKIHTKGLQDKITFTDDRLTFVAFKVLAETNVSTDNSIRDWFIIGRYLDIYTTNNPPAHSEELKKFVAIQLGFTGEPMSEEQAKEYKRLGKILNAVDYGDLLPNFVLDAFARAEDGEEIQMTIPYVESATDEWKSLKAMCNLMLEDAEGEVKKEWESLLQMCNLMLEQ